MGLGDGFLGGAGEQFGAEVPGEGFLGVGQRAGDLLPPSMTRTRLPSRRSAVTALELETLSANCL